MTYDASAGPLVTLDGTCNTRDLGGHRTVDGGLVRTGLVFRSDDLAMLTDDDVTELFGRRGVAMVVDLRDDDEIARRGRDRLTGTAAWVGKPLADGPGRAMTGAIYDAVESGAPERLTALLGEGRAAALGIAAAHDFVSRPEAREGVAAVLRLLADEGTGPLLFHCVAGKDRTGYLAAVILRLLGVAEETVVEDYLRSNWYRRRVNREQVRMLSDAGLPVDVLLPLIEQRRDVIAAFLREVRDRHGSFEAYAIDGIGVDEATLTRMRARLLTGHGRSGGSPDGRDERGLRVGEGPSVGA